jgi:hypothetical protein
MPSQRHFELRSQARERRLELVGRIGRETPLDLEALLDTTEHLVEGIDQSPDLVLLSRTGKPFAQASLANLARPIDDAVDRTKGAPGQDHAGQSDPDQDAHGHAGEQPPRGVENSVGIVERHRHLNGVAGPCDFDRQGHHANRLFAEVIDRLEYRLPIAESG